MWKKFCGIFMIVLLFGVSVYGSVMGCLSLVLRNELKTELEYQQIIDDYKSQLLESETKNESEKNRLDELLSWSDYLDEFCSEYDSFWNGFVKSSYYQFVIIDDKGDMVWEMPNKNFYIFDYESPSFSLTLVGLHVSFAYDQFCVKMDFDESKNKCNYTISVKTGDVGDDGYYIFKDIFKSAEVSLFEFDYTDSGVIAYSLDFEGYKMGFLLHGFKED